MTDTVVVELTAEMEAKFKEKGLFVELDEHVGKAIDMTDDQVKGALLVMRSPLITPTGQVPNILDLKNEDGTVDERIDVARAQAQIPWDPNAAFNGKVLMGMWRRVVEVEALNRGLADVNLSKVMTAIAKRAADLPILVEGSEEASDASEEKPQKVRKSSEVTSDEPVKKAGFTAKNAPDSLRKQVVELRNQGLAFHLIEKTLGLRQVRGMTAHRIYNAAIQARK